MIYDTFYISKEKINDDRWKSFSLKFPYAQKVENLKSFEEIKKKALTKFFWIVWDDLIVDKSFNFEYRISKWDEQYIHVFKNGDFYDGITLFSKDHHISKKEFDHRFFSNKKEVDIVASHPKPFDNFNISTYQEYLDAAKISTTNMFWAVWDDVELIEELNYQVPWYNQHITHVFKNDKYFDGVCLFNKNNLVSEKEFKYRFFLEKKEIELAISRPKPFDVIFISYNEPNADENYEILKSKFPLAKRIDKVKGIHQAHIEAAKISETEMFWVVDGDAIITDTFKFEIDYIPHYDVGNRENFFKTVRVWSSQNPINGLIYGYGGVKLLPRDLTLNMDLEKTDVTTGISNDFKVMDSISNITAFNTDEFNTWKSAFRECTKLASKVIDSNYDQETDSRLNAWCKIGEDRLFGKYALAGAMAGRDYGYSSIGDNDALIKINDFEWLKEKYETWLKNNEQ